MPSTQRVGFVFTLNNWTAQNLQELRALANHADVKYACWSQEVGATGTPHLQGYIHFREKKTTAFCHTLVSHASFMYAKGLPEHSRLYVRKGEQSKDEWDLHKTEGPNYGKNLTGFEEIGELPAKPGKRTDIDRFYEDVEAGWTSRRELMNKHRNVFARYPKFVETVLAEFAPRPPAPDIVLRDWQQELHAKLVLPAHDRKVLFYVDHAGNAGKSTFALYLVSHRDDVQIIHPGRLNDMAYELDAEKRIIIIDVPRSQMEFLQYQFLEYCKNMLVPSHKYTSQTKFFRVRPHVVVFCNEQPDMNKLSADRYDIYSIN